MATAPARRRRRTIDTDSYLVAVARLVTNGGRRVADGNVEDLAQLLELRNRLDEAILTAVAGLRDTGVTWQEIGDTIGTTRQAAIMRWAAKVDEINGVDTWD